ncbi:prepilin peptidase [Plantactinospora sp. WMMC1484]|uniref:prepilin peptidase n=1 Tax=Plantactinospora sp. WMMC1484 TaxID=3404122 RepID=UPI003BF4B54F
MIAGLAGGFLGLLAGPVLRGRIFRYAVPAGQPWRRDCPSCAAAAVGRPTLRNPLGALPPTGRCPHCRHPVGPRPGLVELIAVIVFAALAIRAVGVDTPATRAAPVASPDLLLVVLPLPAYAWIASVGIVAGVVDVAVRRLPDRLTLPAAGGFALLLGAAAIASAQLSRYAVAAACALAAAGVYLGLVLLSPGSLGAGDAKLALGLGFATGWYGWSTALSGLLAGLLLASGYAAILLRLRRIGRRDHLPHGPAMLTGALAALVVG